MAAEVAAHPELFDELMGGLLAEDPVVRMRAADAAEKVTREHPEWLVRYKRMLLDLASRETEKEVRWHLAQMLPRLPLTAGERREVADVMRGYLEDRSSILRTLALHALTDLTKADGEGREEVRALLEQAVRSGTPAMRARAKRLLRQI